MTVGENKIDKDKKVTMDDTSLGEVKSESQEKEKNPTNQKTLEKVAQEAKKAEQFDHGKNDAGKQS